MRLIILLVAFVLISNFLMAQEVNESGVFHLGQGEIEWGYAQGRKVGNTLYISGTVSRGANMKEQVEGIFQRIGKTLSHYGLDASHVVKETVYTTDIEAMQEANEPRMAFYNGNTPAATWVEIKRLFSPSALVEIEVVASFP